MYTVTDLSVADALARMEAVLHARGWCQGDFTDDAGQVCLEGAARYVVTGRASTLWSEMSEREADLMQRVERVLADAVARSGGPVPLAVDPFGVIVEWNDVPRRTVEDVRRLLAAARGRAGGAS